MNRASLRRLGRVLMLVAFAGVMAACATVAPQDTLDPAGPVAETQDNLFRPVFWIAAAIFFLVEGAIVFAAIKFRARGRTDEPKQIHGNTRLELTWTLIPALLLAGIAVPTVLTIFTLNTSASEDDLHVHVIAKQWWWEYEYLDGEEVSFVTANEMVVPEGRRVFLTLDSPDVIHSFWIPRLAGKQDVVPGRTNTLQFATDENTIEKSENGDGWFEGQCAEYCGLSHANMRLRVRVVPQAEFDRWATEQEAPAVTPTSGDAAAGRALFFDPAFNEKLETDACINCHAIRGTDAAARIGPDLTHFASRETFAGALVRTTEQNVHDWILNTRAIKPGVVMPIFEGRLTDEEVRLLVAYLLSLR